MNAASLVKQVLGHLAFALVGDIDAPILDNITLRHVLSHTTGLPNWRTGDELTPLRSPGVQWGYSGEAFVLLQSDSSGARTTRSTSSRRSWCSRRSVCTTATSPSRTWVPRLSVADHDRVRLRKVPRPRLSIDDERWKSAVADRRRAGVERRLGDRARSTGGGVAVGPELKASATPATSSSVARRRVTES